MRTPGPSPKSGIIKGFEQLWADLFTSPVHLDSALSKRPRALKMELARIVPRILLHPVSLAESLGVGVASGDPWRLAGPELARWSAARQMAERIIEGAEEDQTDIVWEDFPPFMVQEWKREWGSETAEGLRDALACPAPLSIRVNRRFEREQVADQLERDIGGAVSPESSAISPRSISFESFVPVMGAPGFERGEFEIQDEGSQLMALFALWPDRVAPWLGISPGALAAPSGNHRAIELPESAPAWTVVDACAGAGGKSLALADFIGGKGRIFAYDVSETKLQALRRRARRAGVNNIQAVALEEGNEIEITGRFRRRAQVVLVDAPCTGWGVLRRNPDIKWRQSPDALERLPEVQLRLLTLYADLVAPGGRLVFGVCTFRKAETLGVVERFLASRPDFKAMEGGFLGPGPTDGFFMQAFTHA